MERNPLRVGLIGYGAVGQSVAQLITTHASPDITVVGALVHHPAYPRPSGIPGIVTTLPALLDEKPHVIVEAAGHEGLREHGLGVLRAGVDLYLVSVGALAEPHLLDELRAAAMTGHAQIKIVFGAIGGLDALAAAAIGGLTTVVHTMRKPPETLLPPAEATTLATAREIFRGNARQAVIQFPAFLNVAAAVALAGKGFDQTEVRVFADPAVRNSVHEVYAEGAFGTLRCELHHAPISSFGRGAQLVAMSIVHALQQRTATLVIG